MLKNVLPTQYVVGLFFFLLVVSLFALPKTQASPLIFLFFDVSWLVVLVTILLNSKYYVYFFSAIMLFLGFWLKYLSYVLFKVQFLEPVGYWWGLQSKNNWNHVLLISSWVAVGFLSVNFVFSLVNLYKKNKANASLSKKAEFTIQWYAENRTIAWVMIISLAVVISVINMVGQIYATGIIPRWILPFHLNAVIFWIISFFIVLSMVTFANWDHELQVPGRRRYYYCILFIACLFSITMLSRAIYLFWTVPYILIVMKYNLGLKRWFDVAKNNKLLIFTYVLLAFVSLISVSALRFYYYHNTQPDKAIVNSQPLSAELNKSESQSVVSTKKTNNSQKQLAISDNVAKVTLLKRVMKFITLPESELHQVLSLITGRWIGMEAVMATTVYPFSGWDLFVKGIKEKPRLNHVGIYSEQILGLNYNFASGRLAASLPGLTGILNYSGSLLVVYCGIFLVILLLCLVENLAFNVVKSEFFVVQQGILIGYWCVSGLNVPYLGLINLLEVLLVAVLIALIGVFFNLRRNLFNRVVASKAIGE